MQNKKWKRTAKRVWGICMREHPYDCSTCRVSFDCINKMSWCGCYIGIRESEKIVKKRNIQKSHSKRT